MTQRFFLDEAVFLSAVEDLKRLYQGFPLESQVWARDGHRRSPYRALILFGLSPRTRDPLLVVMCRRFFAQFPSLESFLEESRSQFKLLRSLVRAGQVPFIQSAAVVLDGCREVPQDAPALLEIRGVGEKVAECVMGYGWGREALPVDAHVCRVVTRISSLPASSLRPWAAEVRERLKGLFNRHRDRLASWQIAMIDIHELLRLHGQVLCTAAPQCSRCPLSRCWSRRSRYTPSPQPVVSNGIWEDWRQLLLDPTCGNIPANPSVVSQRAGGGHEPGCI